MHFRVTGRLPYNFDSEYVLWNIKFNVHPLGTDKEGE